jgi:D-threonine aldolase
MNPEWYIVNNIEEIDSPALLVYIDRVKQNINTLVGSIDNVERLRPHIKTHKSSEIARMMMDARIRKFKCATIAEAEMLGTTGAPDVLLAYQPVGPKAKRLAELTEEFPKTTFSCLIDNYESASHLSSVFQQINAPLNVYIDLNVGMNRTGISPEKALDLYQLCSSLKGIKIVGLHAYDGHLRDADLASRTKKCDEAYGRVVDVKNQIREKFQQTVTIVAGGTPTYSIHTKRKDCECSPGTFVYWDKGYEQLLKEQQYLFAALVVTRVISLPAENIVCVDLGHKAIAAENPLNNRVYFLNAPDLVPVGHSEEHMVFEISSAKKYKVGDVLYGVPHHICPTVALHDVACVIEKQQLIDCWENISRNRKITI